MTKKLIALLLSAVMLFSLTACKLDEKSDASTTSQSQESADATPTTNSVVVQALALVEKGDLYGAYDLLYNLKERNEEQQKLFEKFQFIKVSNVKKDADSNVVYDEQWVYNDDGYLLTHNKVDSIDNEPYTLSETNTYDANNHLLTYTRDNNKEVVHTYDENGNMLSSQYGEHISEEFTYHSNGQLASYTYKTPALAALLYGIYGPQLYTVTYDKNGNVLKEKWVNNDGDEYDEYWRETVYTYDANGNLLTNESFSTDDDFVKRPKYTYTYDENGNVLSEVAINVYDSYNDTCLDVTTTYTYDKKGNVLTKNVSKSDGYWEKEVNTYDGNSNHLSREWSNSNGRNGKTVYTYDSNSNLLSSEISYSDGSWIKEINTYDSNSNLLSSETSYSDGSWIKKINAYDSNGNLLSYEKSDSDGDIEKEIYTYDEQGRVLTYNKIKDGYTDESLSYTYDEQGNKTYTKYGYITTCDKYGNVIKQEWDSDASYDDSWGYVYYVEPYYYYCYYSYELFYYPDGAPWPAAPFINRLSNSPRTEHFVENPVTKKIENLPTSNFYYQSIN